MDGRLPLDYHEKTVNATIDGVGMLIGPRALKAQSSIEKIQPRMIVATFIYMYVYIYIYIVRTPVK